MLSETSSNNPLVTAHKELICNDVSEIKEPFLFTNISFSQIILNKTIIRRESSNTEKLFLQLKLR